MALTLDRSTIGATNGLEISNVENSREQVGILVSVDATFDGNNTNVRLQQSNVKTAVDEDWHDLPEGAQTIDSDETFFFVYKEFYGKYLRMFTNKGNATVGILTITTNYKD